MDRYFWWPPGGPQAASCVFKPHTNIKETRSFATFQECKNVAVEWIQRDANQFFCDEKRREYRNACLYSRTRCATKHINSLADLVCVKGMKGFRRNRSVRNTRDIIDIGIRIARSIKGFEGINDIRSKGVRAILSIAGHEEHQEHQRHQEHQEHQTNQAHPLENKPMSNTVHETSTPVLGSMGPI